MSDPITITVNGKVFGGWKECSVARSLETISGAFALQVSDRFPLQLTRWQIKERDLCTVQVAGETIITGQVDRRGIQLDAGAHSLTIEGRDKTGDLVDCSAIVPKWEFLNQNCLQICSKLAAQFSIPVTLAAGVKLPAPHPKFAINPGDSIFEAIDKACRFAGVMPVSDGKGGILLTRAGTERAPVAIIEGENLLSIGGDFDETKRFAKYIVRGQSVGTNETFGETAAHVEASATDAGARSPRVLLVRPEGPATQAQCKERAQWEATVRAARASVFTVRVQGWTASGALWQLNKLVRCTSKEAGVDTDLLISQVTFKLDQQSGTTTEMVLKRADAYKPEPIVSKTQPQDSFNFGTIDPGSDDTTDDTGGADE